MAVLVNSSNGADLNTSDGTSLSWSLNNASGTFLIVTLATNNATTGVTASYGGVSMTNIHSTSGAPSHYVFKLENPATGSNTVQLNWNETVRASGVSVSFTGVGSTGTIDTASVGSGTTNVTTTETITTNDLFLGTIAYRQADSNLAVVTGSDIREQGSITVTSDQAYNTGSGSVSVAWSRGLSAAAVYAGIPLIGTTDTGNFLMFM